MAIMVGIDIRIILMLLHHDHGLHGLYIKLDGYQQIFIFMIQLDPVLWNENMNLW